MHINGVVFHKLIHSTFSLLFFTIKYDPILNILALVHTFTPKSGFSRCRQESKHAFVDMCTCIQTHVVYVRPYQHVSMFQMLWQITLVFPSTTWKYLFPPPVNNGWHHHTLNSGWAPIALFFHCMSLTTSDSEPLSRYLLPDRDQSKWRKNRAALFHAVPKACGFPPEEDASGSFDLEILERRGGEITLSLLIHLGVIKEAEQAL